MKAERKKKQISFGRLTLIRLVVLGLLTVLFDLFALLKNNKQVCEFFAKTFSRAWIYIFGNVLGWIPISFYELFLIVAIVGAVVFVVLEIVFLAKRKWQSCVSGVLIVVITVVAFLDIYTATASFSYGRESLPDEVYSEYSGDDLSFEEAVVLAESIINQVNNDYHSTLHDANGNIVYPYTFAEMSNMLVDEYERLQSDYFSPYTPRGKQIINKRIMSELHLTGVFFAPFGEANVNGYEVDNLYFPHTLAHEMAHGKGVMREYEANLVASYICLTSDNPYLRYGALAQCMYSAIGIVRLYPNSKAECSRLQSMIDDGILAERVNYSKFYAQFTLLDDVGQWFNDIYLKLNKQQDGVGSYYKDGETAGTGQIDNDGNEIKRIIKFAGTQNLLIKLYKENRL